MKNSTHQGGRFFKILTVWIFLLFFISCVSNNTANQNANKKSNTARIAENSSPAASDDAEELAKIVKLPLTPEEVLWIQNSPVRAGNQNAAANTTNPDNKKLVAVLKFSGVDSEALTSQVQKISPPQDVAIEPEEWFPPELIAESETTGDQSLKGKLYNARDFLQEPFKNGRLIKLEQPGYFVLEMTTF